MVLGMVIDGDGIPVCSEMWPGNTTDVTTLDQVAQRLQSRFGVRRVCLVADAGMISKKMIAAVEARGWFYILGARLRRTKEVREVVLSDTGAFDTVEVARQRPDPMELQVKEVTVNDTPCKGAAKAPHKPRRYVVCRNPDQARKDAATRAQILAGLESKLRSSGPKSVVANKGYKRYLKAEKGAFAVDLDKARDEQRFDGMWVLRTNTELSAVEIALRYKQLWMVEQIFRTAKSLLDTRPIFHKTDATICGHVFCSFLALVLRDELFRRMDNAAVTAEWDDILRDLNALTETAITYNARPSWYAATSSASPARLHNASGSDCPTPCARSTLRRRSLTQVPEHRRVESRRTLACSAKAFPVPDNSLTSNTFNFSTVEDELNEWVEIMRGYESNPVSWDTHMAALRWLDPEHDTGVIRDLGRRLRANGSALYCVWSGRRLTESFEIDHCFPFAAWPCNDLWNLPPEFEESQPGEA